MKYIKLHLNSILIIHFQIILCSIYELILIERLTGELLFTHNKLERNKIIKNCEWFHINQKQLHIFIHILTKNLLIKLSEHIKTLQMWLNAQQTKKQHKRSQPLCILIIFTVWNSSGTNWAGTYSCEKQ